MSDQKYKLCVICKKNFAPLCKDDTICKACTSVALQNKNKNIPCEPYVKNVKEITFQDGTKVTSNKPLFRGQQDMNNCIPGTSNIAPRNSESTATLADHIAGPNNFGAKNTSFVSFTKNLKSAQEFGRGRDDNSSGTVLYADGNALYCNRNVNVHDVSTVEKAAQAFPGNTNPDKAAAKYAVVHQEVSIEANANGIPVKKGVTGMTNKSTYVTAKVASLTYPTTKGVVDKRINNKIEKKGNSSSFSSHAKSTVVKGPSAHCSASSGICDMVKTFFRVFAIRSTCNHVTHLLALLRLIDGTLMSLFKVTKLLLMGALLPRRLEKSPPLQLAWRPGVLVLQRGLHRSMQASPLLVPLLVLGTMGHPLMPMLR